MGDSSFASTPTAEEGDEFDEEEEDDDDIYMNV